jgi:AraC family ethanolamine operon transcriptional activator
MDIGQRHVGAVYPAGLFAALNFAQTQDIDEQAAFLMGWNQIYAQTSSGRFRGSIFEVQLDDIHLFKEETGSSLYQLGALPNDLYAIGVPLKLSGLATFCGAHCDGQSLHVFSGSDGFEFLTPGGLIMSGVVITRAALADALSDDDKQAVLPSLRRAHLRRVPPDRLRGFRDVLAGIFELFRVSPDLANDANVINTLRRSLISNLSCALMDHSEIDQPFVAPSRRWQIVRDALELSTQEFDKPLTVAELCRALRVSRRTLQYCFQEVLGIGPAVFLRAVRLSGARRALKTASSVTQAASLWGFLHFGRFAHDYKLMFGERPSDTFQRFHAAARGF